MEEFEYTKENLRRLQLAELEILKEVDRMCRENGIEYIIEGGTLLGAVRHEGFIPWDDDVDLRMLRKDYERFCELCDDKLDERYFLQTHKTDKNYRWEFARVLKNGTELIRRDRDELKSRTGIFIDIFPTDNLPEKGFGNKLCTGLSWLCRKTLFSEVGKHRAKGLWNKVGFAFLDLLPKSWAHKGIEYLVKKYRDSSTKKVRCLGWGAPEETAGLQKEWLENTCDMKFEDMVVKAPVNAHAFLVHFYGEDYMTPPPEDKREPRHTAKYIKFDTE